MDLTNLVCPRAEGKDVCPLAGPWFAYQRFRERNFYRVEQVNANYISRGQSKIETARDIAYVLGLFAMNYLAFSHILNLVKDKI